MVRKISSRVLISSLLSMMLTGIGFGANLTLEPVNTVWSFQNGGQVYILQQAELNAGNDLALDSKTPIKPLYMGKMRLVNGSKVNLVDSYTYGQPASYTATPITLNDNLRVDYFENTTDRYELPVVSPDGRYVTVNKFNRLQKILAAVDRSRGKNELRPLVSRSTSDDVFSANNNQGEYYERDISWLANAAAPKILFVSNGQIMVGEPSGSQFNAQPAGFSHDGIPFGPQWRSRTEIVWTEKNKILVGNLETRTTKAFSRPDYESIPRIDLNKADPDLVAYVGRKGGNAVSGILNLATGEFTQIAGDNSAEAFNVTWSPNGYELAYVLLDSRARLRTLNLYDIRTGQARQVSNEAYTLTRDSYPTFYPDGSAIFYVGEDEYGLSKLLYSDASKTNQSQAVAVKFGDREVQSVQGVAFYPNRLEEVKKGDSGVKLYLIAQAIARPELYEIPLGKAKLNGIPINLSLPKTAHNNYIGSPRAIVSVEATRNQFDDRYRQAQKDYASTIKDEKSLVAPPKAQLSYPAGLTSKCAVSMVDAVKSEQQRFESQLAQQLSSEFATFKQQGQAGLNNLDREKRSAVRKDPDLTLEKVFGEWEAILNIPRQNREQAEQDLATKSREWEQKLRQAQDAERSLTAFLNQQSGTINGWKTRMQQLVSNAQKHFGSGYPQAGNTASSYPEAYAAIQSTIQQSLTQMENLQTSAATRVDGFAREAGCDFQQEFQVLQGEITKAVNDLQALYNELQGFQKVWDDYAGVLDEVKQIWSEFQSELSSGDAHADNNRLPKYNTSREQLKGFSSLRGYYPDEIADLKRLVYFMEIMASGAWPNPADNRAVLTLQAGANVAKKDGAKWIQRARNGVIIQYVKSEYFPGGKSVAPRNKDLKDVQKYIAALEKDQETDTRDFGKLLKALDSYEAGK
ncbi:MAG: hypothetical protein K9N11_04375 [Lentisphaeria bacterium]|nr:hypothetical protein [Candidatus Neomarinimicrobiota bacterium]MCF7842070.1 hypothetical protein [Lentisphaeria bacterium]